MKGPPGQPGVSVSLDDLKKQPGPIGPPGPPGIPGTAAVLDEEKIRELLSNLLKEQMT